MTETIPAAALAENLYRTNAAAESFSEPTTRDLAHASAEINADDTAFEQGFDYDSDEWFECYAASFEFMLDVTQWDW